MASQISESSAVGSPAVLSSVPSPVDSTKDLSACRLSTPDDRLSATDYRLLGLLAPAGGDAGWAGAACGGAALGGATLGGAAARGTAAGLLGDGAAAGGAPNAPRAGAAGLIIRGVWNAEGGGGPGNGRGCACHATAPLFGAGAGIAGCAPWSRRGRLRSTGGYQRGVVAVGVSFGADMTGVTCRGTALAGRPPSVRVSGT